MRCALHGQVKTFFQKVFTVLCQRTEAFMKSFFFLRLEKMFQRLYSMTVADISAANS